MSQLIIEVTWEDVKTIKGKFPHFCLEDKVIYIPKCIDTTISIEQPLKVYVKRNKKQTQSSKAWLDISNYDRIIYVIDVPII